MCMQEHNKEKYGVDRYEQVLSFFTIMWDLWTVTENFCSRTAKLHVHVVYKKIMKYKAEFKLDLNEIFGNCLLCQTIAHLVMQLPHFKHYGMHMKGRAPCYALQGLHFIWKQKWNNLRMWKGVERCEKVWKGVESLHIFLRALKGITHPKLLKW